MSESESENALRKNINAARTIVQTVKSTLGPLGRDKMMVDMSGDALVTNDGATILRELDTAHPGAKMIIECSKTQEIMCHDGTTSAVVLAGELLSNSESLLNKGLHPNVVCRGYNDAAQMAVDYLMDVLSDDNTGYSYVSKDQADGTVIGSIARTAITGKTVDAALDTVANLCVQAVKKAGSAEKVRVLSLPGGSLRDSYLFDGAVVNKSLVIDKELEENQHVVLVNTGLEQEKTNDNVQVQMDVEGYTQFKSSYKDDLLSQAKLIIEQLPDGGVVFVRDGALDHVCAYLNKNNVNVIRRLPESTMRALSATLGLPVAQTPSDLECSAKATIMKELHNDVEYIFVQGAIDSDQSTLILRGATNTTLEEIERGFDDALGVVSLVMGGDRVVAGGGSAFAAIASHLRSKAATVEGMAQMAIDAFADSLEIIPATIAENAGQDPLDCILSLRHSIQNGELSNGPNVEVGGITNMRTLGVMEPASLIKQAILGATEVTVAMLKIDDVIAKRGE